MHKFNLLSIKNISLEALLCQMTTPLQITQYKLRSRITPVGDAERWVFQPAKGMVVVAEAEVVKQKALIVVRTHPISKVARLALHLFYTPDKDGVWIQSQLLSDRTINYEAGLLSVESDRLRGNLIFRAKPGLSNKELENIKRIFKCG